MVERLAGLCVSYSVNRSSDVIFISGGGEDTRELLPSVLQRVWRCCLERDSKVHVHTSCKKQSARSTHSVARYRGGLGTHTNPCSTAFVGEPPTSSVYRCPPRRDKKLLFGLQGKFRGQDALKQRKIQEASISEDSRNEMAYTSTGNSGMHHRTNGPQSRKTNRKIRLCASVWFAKKPLPLVRVRTTLTSRNNCGRLQALCLQHTTITFLPMAEIPGERRKFSL